MAFCYLHAVSSQRDSESSSFVLSRKKRRKSRIDFSSITIKEYWVKYTFDTCESRAGPVPNDTLYVERCNCGGKTVRTRESFCFATLPVFVARAPLMREWVDLLNLWSVRVLMLQYSYGRQ